MSVLLVLCTCPNDQVAAEIAADLVELNLAACVNRIPGVVSTYRWAGKLHVDHEVLLLIKTTPTRYEALEQRLRQRHPYELPEIMAVKVDSGWAPYLQWVEAATAG